MNREGETPKVSIGFVTGLDYTDARFSVHDVLQEFKLHPLVRKILDGGKRVAWGAKAIPEGGYWAMPTLHAPGMVIAATPAAWSTCPSSRASTTRSSPAGWPRRRSTSSSRPARATSRAYEDAIYASEMGKELYESRNMKQPFAKGLVLGGAITNAMVVTKGRFPGGHWATHRDAEAPLTLTRPREALSEAGRQVHVRQALAASSSPATRPATTRRRTSASSSACRARSAKAGPGCAPPASTRSPTTRRRRGMIDLIVNPSNCVQCGAITAKGGRLTPPEGGDGAGLPDHLGSDLRSSTPDRDRRTVGRWMRASSAVGGSSPPPTRSTPTC